ncbi:hypothetical protein ACIQKE_10015 [Streptomyces griseoviridis]
MAFHNRLLTEAGEPAATTWSPERRLESEVEENRWRPPAPDAVPGDTRLTLRPLWRPPVDVPLDLAREAHGGGDPRLLDALFGTVEGRPVEGRPPTASAHGERP